MVNIAQMFPKSWQVKDGIIKRGGGRDKDGNYQEPTELPLGVVLVGPNASDEEQMRTDLATTLTTVYGDSDLEVMSTDTVEFPSGRFKGSWVVNGESKPWPLGLEIHLRKV